jgi:hypothetical protein
MTSRLINRIHVGTFVALIFAVALFFLMAIIIPNGATLWADKQWAAEQIRRAETPEQLRQMLQFAASSTSAGQHAWRECLNIFMFATAGMIGFLGRSLYLIRRLKREVSSDQNT